MRGAMRKIFPAMGTVLLLLAPLSAPSQKIAAADETNAGQARAALDAMVRALGGEAWLNQKNLTREGRAAVYFQGRPTGEMTRFRETRAWPDRDRIELTQRRDIVDFYLGRVGWEATYKGRALLPAAQLDSFLRRRDHSIQTAVRLWLRDPRTLLLNGGRQMIERHQTVQVTVLSPRDQAVTLFIDAETHLPVRSSFQWRDPDYHDMDTEADEYDDYHNIDGIATPFIVTRYENGQVARQYFFDSVVYNRTLPPDFWSVKAAVQRIEK